MFTRVSSTTSSLREYATPTQVPKATGAIRSKRNHQLGDESSPITIPSKTRQPASTLSTIRQPTGRRHRKRNPSLDTTRQIAPFWSAYACQFHLGENVGVDLGEWRRLLRVAVAGGDGAGIVELCSGELPVDCLQAIGSALLRIAPDIAGAAEVTDRCVALLGGREWQGDAELVSELHAHQGSEPPLALTVVPVDLEELGEVFNDSGGAEGGLVDLETGSTWSAEVLENARDSDIDDVPDKGDGTRWLEVWPEGHGSRDLTAFVATLDDPEVAAQLQRTLERKGAFRRFRQELDRWPHEASRWHAFRDDRTVGRARSWLADEGYRSGSPGSSPA